MGQSVALNEGQFADEGLQVPSMLHRTKKNTLKLKSWLQTYQHYFERNEPLGWIEPEIFSIIGREKLRKKKFYQEEKEKGVYLNPTFFRWLRKQRKVGYMAMDNDFNIVSWNLLATHVLGIDDDSTSQEDWKRAFQSISPYNHKHFQHDDLPLLKAQLTGDIVKDVDIQVYNQLSGLNTSIRISAAPIKALDGTIIGSLSFFKQISEDEIFAHAVHANLQEVILLVNDDGKIENLPASSESILHICSADLFNTHIDQLVPNWDMIVQAFPSADGPNPHTTTVEFGHPEGWAKCWLEARIMRRHLPDQGEKWIIYLKDISEQKSQQALMEEMKEKVRTYSFLVSHELREPIVNILGLLQILELEKEVDEQMLEMFKSMAEKLDSLTRQATEVLTKEESKRGEFN